VTLENIAWIAFTFALIPFLVYLANYRFFDPPPPIPVQPDLPSVSILIPARNEERSIAAAIESALTTKQIQFEIVVLDDHSTDRTAEIVEEFAKRDARVRLEDAPPLPRGWCGKQHACYSLSRLAKSDYFLFVDADVRLQPEAVARMVAFQQSTKAELVSGFPRQETDTWLEKLVIPIIHFLLLGFLPFRHMKRSTRVGFAAGCGQLFLARRESYELIGGHSAIKDSLHDGIKLPRAYRKWKFKTDLCDTTQLAVCRMYHSASEVWLGFSKNAREGLAANGTIVPFTFILFAGQILPWILLGVGEGKQIVLIPSFLAIAMSLLIRVDAKIRFQQSWLGVIAHPIGIGFVLSIQWYAMIMELLGKPVGWRGRVHPSLDEPETVASTVELNQTSISSTAT
jgi:glycosyltransferase involved in cell wall biosynthesis